MKEKVLSFRFYKKETKDSGVVMTQFIKNEDGKLEIRGDGEPLTKSQIKKIKVFLEKEFPSI